MYRAAAADLSIDLARSAYIGDRWRDVQPAQSTGGIGILVPGSETPEEDVEQARQHISGRLLIAHDIGDAFSIGLHAVAASSLTLDAVSVHPGDVASVPSSGIGS